ncbi:MAG: MFS transporter [Deltaproteobacteria bacterium]|nr:MFS transporter [Deltaproteobacteria bacterium]MCL4874792.1 MFS transporter [bacterium]
MGTNHYTQIGLRDLFDLKRADTVILHKTWFAFFLTFFVWFNMAPLATTIAAASGLTMDELKLLAVCNVALAAPGRFIMAGLTDRFGPRKTLTLIMVAMSVPCLAFAFAGSYGQMLVSRLLLGMVGTGLMAGIHMTSLWFRPRDIGFVQGVEAGLGNWGSSIAAMLMPVLALNVFGSWRLAIALSGALMLIYGVYFWSTVSDGPGGALRRSPGKGSAIEVSSWGDLVMALLWTAPITGVLALLVWRMRGMGYIGGEIAALAYAIIAAAVLYQMVRVVRLNVPMLKKGVPDRDRYRFTDVGALCLCYVATFGAEVAVISMLPVFLQHGFSLTPQLAGLLAAAFAFLNIFSRALGGYITGRMPAKRGTMLVYLAGVAVSFSLMGLITPEWPILSVVLVILLCALFVTGGCGITYAIVPLIKRRMTGRISGYVGAYGNVGAVVFLVAYTFMGESQFFYLIGAAALAAFLFCLFFMKEPAGAFSKEYQLYCVGKRPTEGGRGRASGARAPLADRGA